MPEAENDGALLRLTSIETSYGLSQVLFGVSLAIAPASTP